MRFVDGGIVAAVTKPSAKAVTLAPVPDSDGELPELFEDAVDDSVVVEPEDDDAWTHEKIEFLGDTLEVRKPTEQALAAYSLATSKYVSMQIRNDMTGLFISRHLSPASYERVFSRLMDPDDDQYTIETIGLLMRSVVELRIS